MLIFIVMHWTMALRCYRPPWAVSNLYGFKFVMCRVRILVLVPEYLKDWSPQTTKDLMKARKVCFYYTTGYFETKAWAG